MGRLQYGHMPCLVSAPPGPSLHIVVGFGTAPCNVGCEPWKRRTRNQKRRVGQKLSFLDRCWDCCHCNLARNAAKIGCMSSTLGRRPGWHNDKTTPTVPKLKSTKHVDSKAQPWKRRAESHFSRDWTSKLERWAMAKSGFPVCCSGTRNHQGCLTPVAACSTQAVRNIRGERHNMRETGGAIKGNRLAAGIPMNRDLRSQPLDE